MIFKNIYFFIIFSLSACYLIPSRNLIFQSDFIRKVSITNNRSVSLRTTFLNLVACHKPDSVFLQTAEIIFENTKKKKFFPKRKQKNRKKYIIWFFISNAAGACDEREKKSEKEEFL